MLPVRKPWRSTGTTGSGGDGAATPQPAWRGFSGYLTAPRRWPSIGSTGAAILAIAVGIAFRVAEYLGDRALWLDEKSLLANVSGRPLFEFGVPLQHDQMAPPGFLVIARAWVSLLGDSSYAIRLLPLVCGVAALIALQAVARRYLSEAAVPIALALCAVSDDLIYYATEFKQYSTDLLITLGGLWLGADLATLGWTWRRAAIAGVLGVAATWLSHPAVFVLAAIGATVALDAIARRQWRRLGAALGLGSVWAVGFAGCLAVSEAMMMPQARQFLWSWWDFAFLPLPPRSASEAGQVFWQFANVFTNPVGIVSPLGPRGTALLALALFLAGAVSLTVRGWRGATVILLPIAMTMGASALERYPFHGRVILFLVPCFVLPVAEGVALVGRRCGRAVMLILVALLLVAPVSEALDHILVRARQREFDSHGDQRNDLLDDLDRRRMSLVPAHRPPPTAGEGSPSPRASTGARSGRRGRIAQKGSGLRSPCGSNARS